MNECTQWRIQGGKEGNTPTPLSFSPPSEFQPQMVW